MPSNAMNKWLASRKNAQIGHLLLKPKPHPAIRDSALSVMKGQAEVFFLKSADNHGWVLKKFNTGKLPDKNYLNAVKGLLPQGDTFACGNKREILDRKSLVKSAGCYYTKELADFLEDTILMPQLQGCDWYGLVDRIQVGSLNLTDNQRLNICANLANAVKQLEDRGISHRDLSGGNIFVEPSTGKVALIDFDSLYHQSLRLSHATTIGSEGYIPSFVKADNKLSYCRFADRFALAMLCAEFLVRDKSSKVYHDGTIFDQKHLYQRKGQSIEYVRGRLKQKYPTAFEMFNMAISSNSFEGCPEPKRWLDLADGGKGCEQYSLAALQRNPIITVRNNNILKGNYNDRIIGTFNTQPCTLGRNSVRRNNTGGNNNAGEYSLDNMLGNPVNSTIGTAVRPHNPPRKKVHKQSVFQIGLLKFVLVPLLVLKKFFG